MYKNIYGLKFGTDPELFASYAGTPTAEHDPALPFAMSPAGMAKWHGLTHIGFTDPDSDEKEKHPVYLQNKNWRIIGDGVAYEINLPVPHDDPLSMRDCVLDAIDNLKADVQKRGFDVWTKPIINFDSAKFWTEELMKDKFMFWSTVFGCDPDLDAWNTEWGSPIENVATHPARYGGGHIHISGDDDIAQFPLPFIKLLSLTVGNYVIANSPNPRLEEVRATRYGQPGKYRVQNYKNGAVGVEYRTPSNSWLGYNDQQFAGIFEWINRAVYLLKNPDEGMKAMQQFGEASVYAITRSNRELALQNLTGIGL